MRNPLIAGLFQNEEFQNILSEELEDGTTGEEITEGLASSL